MPPTSIAFSRGWGLRTSYSLSRSRPFRNAARAAGRPAGAVAGDAVHPGGDRARGGQARDAAEAVETSFLQGGLGGVALAERVAQVVAQPRRLAVPPFLKRSLVAGVAAP